MSTALLESAHRRLSSKRYSVPAPAPGANPYDKLDISEWTDSLAHRIRQTLLGPPLPSPSPPLEPTQDVFGDIAHAKQLSEPLEFDLTEDEEPPVPSSQKRIRLDAEANDMLDSPSPTPQDIELQAQQQRHHNILDDEQQEDALMDDEEEFEQYIKDRAALRVGSLPPTDQEELPARRLGSLSPSSSDHSSASSNSILHARNAAEFTQSLSDEDLSEPRIPSQLKGKARAVSISSQESGEDESWESHEEQDSDQPDDEEQLDWSASEDEGMTQVAGHGVTLPEDYDPALVPQEEEETFDLEEFVNTDHLPSSQGDLELEESISAPISVHPKLYPDLSQHKTIELSSSSDAVEEEDELEDDAVPPPEDSETEHTPVQQEAEPEDLQDSSIEIVGEQPSQPVLSSTGPVEEQNDDIPIPQIDEPVLELPDDTLPEDQQDIPVPQSETASIDENILAATPGQDSVPEPTPTPIIDSPEPEPVSLTVKDDSPSPAITTEEDEQASESDSPRTQVSLPNLQSEVDIPLLENDTQMEDMQGTEDDTMQMDLPVSEEVEENKDLPVRQISPVEDSPSPEAEKPAVVPLSPSVEPEDMANVPRYWEQEVEAEIGETEQFQPDVVEEQEEDDLEATPVVKRVPNVVQPGKWDPSSPIKFSLPAPPSAVPVTEDQEQDKLSAQIAALPDPHATPEPTALANPPIPSPAVSESAKSIASLAVEPPTPLAGPVFSQSSRPITPFSPLRNSQSLPADEAEDYLSSPIRRASPEIVTFKSPKTPKPSLKRADDSFTVDDLIASPNSAGKRKRSSLEKAKRPRFHQHGSTKPVIESITSSPSRSTAGHRRATSRTTTTVFNTPITRSHCTFRKISIPADQTKEERPERIIFLIPGCALAEKVEYMTEESIFDLGDADESDVGSSIRIEDEKRSSTGLNLGMSTEALAAELAVPENVIVKLVNVVGLDLLRAGDCEMLKEGVSEAEEGEVRRALVHGSSSTSKKSSPAVISPAKRSSPAAQAPSLPSPAVRSRRSFSPIIPSSASSASASPPPVEHPPQDIQENVTASGVKRKLDESSESNVVEDVPQRESKKARWTKRLSNMFARRPR